MGMNNITNIVKNVEGGILLEKYIIKLQEEYDKLYSITPKVADNYDAIEEELKLTEEAVINLEQQRNEAYLKFLAENSAIVKLNDNLETIEVDINNNKDAKKLRDLGAEVDSLTLKDLCPVCHQRIQDALLPGQDVYTFMSIEENIRHLNSQKQVFEYALRSHQDNKRKLDSFLSELQSKLYTLNRLAKALRNDLYSVDDEYAESVVYKKIEVSKEIEDLGNMQGDLRKSFCAMDQLSERWKKLLEEKGKLPKKGFSTEDDIKIASLRSLFVNNLSKFGYKSLTTMEQIEISKDTYLPVRENFDMKFDSSASDGIRAIWAFTLAIMQTSIRHKGNHPNILMYDEPDQHSIVMKDLKSFFDKLIENKVGQTIIALTIKDSDTEKTITDLNPDNYNIIRIEKRAFVKITEEK
jgi:predicted  nucleic acid-binding Zn-ribbon protein